MTWHTTPTTQRLLASLSPTDVRIVRANGMPGPDGLAWAPATDHAHAVFDKLAGERSTYNDIEMRFLAAETDIVRLAVLTEAQDMPTVQGALSTRFGSANRFMGYEPLDATRRWWAGADVVREEAA